MVAGSLTALARPQLMPQSPSTKKGTLHARRLAESDPERASAYAGVLRAVGRELRERAQHAEHPGALRLVLDDLIKILDALQS